MPLAGLHTKRLHGLQPHGLPVCDKHSRMAVLVCIALYGLCTCNCHSCVTSCGGRCRDRHSACHQQGQSLAEHLVSTTGTSIRGPDGRASTHSPQEGCDTQNRWSCSTNSLSYIANANTAICSDGATGHMGRVSNQNTYSQTVQAKEQLKPWLAFAQPHPLEGQRQHTCSVSKCLHACMPLQTPLIDRAQGFRVCECVCAKHQPQASITSFQVLVLDSPSHSCICHPLAYVSGVHTTKHPTVDRPLVCPTTATESQKFAICL